MSENALLAWRKKAKPKNENKANSFRLVYVNGATLTKLRSFEKIFAAQVHLFSFIYCKLRIKVSLKDYVEHYGLVKKKRITKRKHVERDGGGEGGAALFIPSSFRSHPPPPPSPHLNCVKSLLCGRGGGSAGLGRTMGVVLTKRE